MREDLEFGSKAPELIVSLDYPAPGLPIGARSPAVQQVDHHRGRGDREDDADRHRMSVRRSTALPRACSGDM